MASRLIDVEQMILCGFLLSVLFLYLQTVSPFFSSLPVIAFIPFLSLVSLLSSLRGALRWSCLTGLLIDLLSYDPFGIHALNYTLTTLFCFRAKRYFSVDAPLQWGLYTSLFSALSTFLQIALLFLFDRRVFFQGRWWLTEALVLPICDALYALLWFAGPLTLYRTVRRMGELYWLKKNHSSQN